MTYVLAALKPLSASQYDNVKSQAVHRVQKRIGGKPTRSQFKREYAPLFGVLDMLALTILQHAHTKSHAIYQIQKHIGGIFYDGDINRFAPIFDEIKKGGYNAIIQLKRETPLCLNTRA